MKLLENDPTLADMCRQIESAIGEDPRCQGLQVVVRLTSLDALPESAKTDVFRDGGGAYRRSTREVLLDPCLLSMNSSVAVAVIAHEVGHAVAHAKGMQWEGDGANDPMAEEFIADRLACEWGFEHSLVAERHTSYGEEYVVALRKWPDERTYRHAMNLWRTKRIAGLV